MSGVMGFDFFGLTVKLSMGLDFTPAKKAIYFTVSNFPVWQYFTA